MAFFPFPLSAVGKGEGEGTMTWQWRGIMRAALHSVLKNCMKCSFRYMFQELLKAAYQYVHIIL